MHGNIYGTTFEAVQRVTGADKVCILDVDVQGAEAVKRTQLGAAFVFIAPPSMDELERRLRGRGTETEEKARARGGEAAFFSVAGGLTCCRSVAQIQVRLANARTEMAKRDVPGFFDGIVMNDTLDAGFERLKGALLLRCGLGCICADVWRVAQPSSPSTSPSCRERRALGRP